MDQVSRLDRRVSHSFLPRRFPSWSNFQSRNEAQLMLPDAQPSVNTTRICGVHRYLEVLFTLRRVIESENLRVGLPISISHPKFVIFNKRWNVRRIHPTFMLPIRVYYYVSRIIAYARIFATPPINDTFREAICQTRWYPKIDSNYMIFRNISMIEERSFSYLYKYTEML